MPLEETGAVISALNTHILTILSGKIDEPDRYLCVWIVRTMYDSSVSYFESVGGSAHMLPGSARMIGVLVVLVSAASAHLEDQESIKEPHSAGGKRSTAGSRPNVLVLFADVCTNLLNDMQHGTIHHTYLLCCSSRQRKRHLNRHNHVPTHQVHVHRSVRTMSVYRGYACGCLYS